MRSFIQNLLLAFTSIIITLLLLELAARFLPPPLDGSSNPADTCSNETGWRGKANFTTTVATGNYVHDLALNGAGMHDSDHALTKSAKTLRIIMLGDSFVQAIQVKETETSHQVLEDLLKPRQQIEVISAGVGGWGTGQQLLYYRNQGRAYQPDLVLLMLYMGNDVKDNLPGRGVTVDGYNCYTPYFVTTNGQLNPTPWYFAPGLPPSTGHGWLGQQFINNMLGRVYQHSYLYAHLEPLLSQPPLKSSVLDFYIGKNELFDYGLQLTLELVQQLQHEVEQDGSRFAVVLITPMNLLEFSQLTVIEREKIYQELPDLRRAEDIKPPNEMLTQALTQANVPVLDLFPTFIQHADKTAENLYFKGDHHWNVDGNRLAAEAIAAWLEAHPDLLNTK